VSKPKPLQSTGRRKRAVARVRIVPGTGQWKVNGQELENYFSAVQRMTATEAVRVTETEGMFDITATVHGGGISGQAGAIRLGVARGIVEHDIEHRKSLKSAGMLRRDDREKESKKAGLKKARKAPQYSKR
jgi:small subunit ribosomal protein S9